MSPRTPLLLALSCSIAACDDVARPTPPVLADQVALEVELLAPRSTEILIVGRTAPVRVRAREEGGRVHGLGFVARRSGVSATEPVDSAFVEIGPVADTTVVFQLYLPPTLPARSQVDIYGFALGPAGVSKVSAPRHVNVLVCPSNATWC